MEGAWGVMSLCLNDQNSDSRILFVIGSLDLGGAESQMLMLIRELVRRNIYCEIFTLQANGLLRIHFDEIGVPVHSGDVPNIPYKIVKGLHLLRAFWILRRHARRVNIVHAYLPLTNCMGACAAYLAGVNKIITSRRGLGNHQNARPWWKVFDRVANALSSVVVVNSMVVADDTIRRDGIKKEKLVCIYNGLEAERFRQALPYRVSVRHSLGLNDDAPVAIIVANLISYKGHADLIDAMALIADRFPMLRLLVVGKDNGIGSRLKERAEALSVGHMLHWLGLRQDIPELLAAADIYVCASHEEGFSNSILEAMASGKAVIATKVGGNSEALDHGRLGLLVNPRDPIGLAVAMERLLRDSELMNRLGKLSSIIARERYSSAAMVDKYLSLYSDVR